MGIEYDPTEEVEDDDVIGCLDYDSRQDIWILLCSEHQELERSRDGSAEAHDALIYRWVQHMQEKHHGDGVLSFDERQMLIEPLRRS